MNKIIKFKQEFLEDIMNGSKTQTMRLSAKRLEVQPGEICIAVFPDGQEVILRITGVGYKYFKSIDDEDAKREGFNNADELKECLKEIYNEYCIMDSNRFYYYQFAVIGVKIRRTCEKNYCGQCKSFIRFYCPKLGKQVSYSGKACPDFEHKEVKE